ncbi:MAB_1171c family putative transporter [Streptomyces sp. NPDC097619]|uniref:MAB_1171c family putative transporter n=1 Tax=Streptomyces sp. NPDC097619 TaxID=3157228 RepID=UPI003333DDD7
MRADLAAFGTWLALPSVLLLWAAVLLRAPAAVRSPEQRGLLLAVATAAGAMTLNLPEVVEAAQRAPGTAHLVGLVRNLTGVLSAGAVLYFVSASTGGRRLRPASAAATVVLSAALLVLDATAPAHRLHGMPPGGEPVPSLAYWLVLISAHLVANTVCVAVCWRYGGRAGNRALALGLRLFGLGTALAGLFWLAYLLKALAGVEWPLPYLPLLMNLHGVLRAAAILLPTLFLARRTLGDVTAAWRLWPLWRDLVQAVPHVALHAPRASRLLELLWPPVPRDLLVYRKVIETRDAILTLNEYVAPGVPEQARRYVAETGTVGPRVEAAVLACVINEARRAKDLGRPAVPGGYGAGPIECGDLAGERRFLVDVAEAYGAPSTDAFRPEPD